MTPRDKFRRTYFRDLGLIAIALVIVVLAFGTGIETVIALVGAAMIVVGGGYAAFVMRWPDR